MSVKSKAQHMPDDYVLAYHTWVWRAMIFVIILREEFPPSARGSALPRCGTGLSGFGLLVRRQHRNVHLSNAFDARGLRKEGSVNKRCQEDNLNG